MLKSAQKKKKRKKKRKKKNEKKEQAKNTAAIYGGNSSSTLLFYYRMLGVNQEVPIADINDAAKPYCVIAKSQMVVYGLKVSATSRNRME